MLERATLNVCSSCAHLGTLIRESPPAEQRQVQNAPETQKSTRYEQRPRKKADRPAFRRPPRVEGEISEDYPKILRNGRQKAGLSQEELAKKVAERVTVIKQLERGDLFPDDKVRRKLEKALGVSLMEYGEAADAGAVSSAKGGGGLTLGDMIQIKKE